MAAKGFVLIETAVGISKEVVPRNDERLREKHKRGNAIVNKMNGGWTACKKGSGGAEEGWRYSCGGSIKLETRIFELCPRKYTNLSELARAMGISSLSLCPFWAEERAELSSSIPVSERRGSN